MKRYVARCAKEMAYEDFHSPHILNSADVMYLGAIRQRRVKLKGMRGRGERAAGARRRGRHGIRPYNRR